MENYMSQQTSCCSVGLKVYFTKIHSVPCPSVCVSSHAVQRTSSETSHRHLHAAALLPVTPAATGNLI